MFSFQKCSEISGLFLTGYSYALLVVLLIFCHIVTSYSLQEI